MDLGLPWLWNLFGLNQFLPTPVELHSEFVWACAECPICCNEVIELICGRHHGNYILFQKLYIILTNTMNRCI